MDARRGFLVACCALVPLAGHAAPIVHVKYAVYGCVKPETVAVINSEDNLRQADPGWLAAAMGFGQCVRITPQSPWEPAGVDARGLTLLTYRGTVGRPASFYVPTAAIDFSATDGPDAAQAQVQVQVQPGAGAAASKQQAGSDGANMAAVANGGNDQPFSADRAAAANAPAASDPQLAEVEAGVSQIDPAAQSTNWPLIGLLTLVAAAGGGWIAARRRRARRARLLDAIRLEVAGNAPALRSKREQTVRSDEYGTVDRTGWDAAKTYYVSTRINPIMAAHGFSRLPAAWESELDEIIEAASAH